MIYCFTFFENQGINEFNKNSTYVKNNEVTEIFDNKQRLSVKLEYNKNGQETVRKFGNGTKEETFYDKAGRVTVKAQKSERGELQWAEGYVYGTDGKRTATVDNKGRVTLYEYNKKGQLETVYYPYTQEMINLLKKEAEENGLPANADISENKYLPAEIKSGLIPLLNSMQYGLAYSLPNMQIFVKESYSYDKNGNRTGKTTKCGTINYSYDKENRLVSSGSRGRAFINYTYDNAGNLLTEESANKTTKYAYNTLNRLIYCEVTDKAEKTYAQTTYAYDAFGRRVIVQDKGEAAVRTLYDGFTFDVIKQSSTLANGLFTDSNNTGIRWSPTGKPTGDRYRYISDEEAQDDNRYFYLDENIYKTVNSRYRGERTQISVNGSLAAQASSEGEQYFTTDLSGSVSSVTDSYGYQLGEYTYDAFGSLVQGDLSGVTDFGYLGKQNDPTSKLYNYGFRDYKPEAVRFTTVDPIRDGTNWFAYCNGDSVNFMDLWGLKKLNMLGVPANIQQVLQQKHDKENTRIQVVRNSEKEVSNDVIRIYVDNEVIASYKCQSEKNYRSGEQTRSQSWEDDVANRNVTLPCSDDYKIIMMEESYSYNQPFKIESDSVLIDGKSINNDCFLIHSWDKKEEQINGAYSWGCQILNNEDFKDFRATLENIGFENGDSIPLEIKKNK